MPDTPVYRLTGLLSALALILLLLAPVLVSVSAAPMSGDMAAGGMMAHGHDSTQDEDSSQSCWQQCLNSCSNHCTPVLTSLPLAHQTAHRLGQSRPNLYQPLFPSGLHRPPRT